MKQEFLEASAATRLTEHEANLIVALHADREQRENATTLGDLAETLHISLADARVLLAEARVQSAPAALQADLAPVHRSPWGGSPRLTKVLVGAIVMAVAAFAFMALRLTHPSSSPITATVASSDEVGVGQAAGPIAAGSTTPAPSPDSVEAAPTAGAGAAGAATAGSTAPGATTAGIAPQAAP